MKIFRRRTRTRQSFELWRMHTDHKGSCEAHESLEFVEFRFTLYWNGLCFGGYATRVVTDISNPECGATSGGQWLVHHWCYGVGVLSCAAARTATQNLFCGREHVARYDHTRNVFPVFCFAPFLRGTVANKVAVRGFSYLLSFLSPFLISPSLVFLLVSLSSFQSSLLSRLSLLCNGVSPVCRDTTCDVCKVCWARRTGFPLLEES